MQNPTPPCSPTAALVRTRKINGFPNHPRELNALSVGRMFSGRMPAARLRHQPAKGSSENIQPASVAGSMVKGLKIVKDSAMSLFAFLHHTRDGG